MIDFKDITVDDKEVIQGYTLNSEYRNCDFSFSNLCSWRLLYKTQYATYKDHLIIRFWNGNTLSYLYPIGNGNTKEVIEDMMQDAKQQGQAFSMKGVCTSIVPKIKEMFPDRVTFEGDRDYSDYIYLRENLANLTGKKYQSKRNHINKFKNTYTSYEYLPLTADKIADCIKLEAEWCKAKNCDEIKDAANERMALTFALNNFEKIGLSGGVLYVNGQIVAFTFGMPISNTTFGVNVEKANTDIDGAYAVINNEFAKRIPEQYQYINREEDLGIEG
ncbi:MAG: phosphatidylglycerol lysyltransferase domain-containing protein, partial [Bacteroides sp.]|nr:phosphatidylglycerol lysyltransferase domain-containing protein [Bacteroides sp.]